MSATLQKRDRLTEEQHRAITKRDVSIALSAGAGCGKTFVLTERFLDHFDPRVEGALQPSQLGQLVAITFTDRAAREMRDRIRHKCYERLSATDPHDEKALDYWSSLLRFLDTARVSTIHSFCTSLLRSHAVEAELDPQFSVLEQSEADTILSELVDDTLRRLLADQDPATLNLLVKFSIEGVRELTMDLVQRRERVHFAEWLECQPEDLAERWLEFHRTSVVPAILHKIATCPAATQLLMLLKDDNCSNATMQLRRDHILRILLAWREQPRDRDNPHAELDELRESAKVQGGGGKKDWVDEDCYDAFKSAAEKLRKTIDGVRDLLAFDASAAQPVAQISLQLLEVANAVATVYEDRKRELARLDFDDLLIRAHRLLTDEAHREIQERLSSQVRLLLVDEFQDTDPLQVELVAALCGERIAGGKLFFVGDHKQSIYRFRGADPRVFLDLRERTPKSGRLPLTRNFRSQPAILDFVNALFHQELAEEYEPLVPHRSQVSPTPAIEFLWAPADGEAETKENKELLRRREADWIARRLRTMIDSRAPIVWDAKSAGDDQPAARPAEPGDIALLFRALSDVAEYEKSLQRYQIPYYLVGGHAFYAQQEIYDLVNLLRALASPSDALSLVGVLRSPFFSLADETLFWLAQHPDGLANGLFAATIPTNISADERGKVEFASAAITQLRSLKDQLPVAELINLALDITGYDALLLAEFLGERKLANLRKLIEQARAFDRSGIFTLSDFIEQLSRFIVKQPHEPLAATHPEATNVVRLMSIHQSKGLEFPIVVVPDLERSTNAMSDRVEFTRELGPMTKLKDRAGKRIVGGLELFAVAAQEEDEQELRRLLYVATTRAADYLLLSSGVKNVGDAASPWMQMLARHFDLATGKYLDTPPPGWNVPAIRVTSTLPECTIKPQEAANWPDLAKLVTATQVLADAGNGAVPEHVEPIPVDASARRQFSFSRLTGSIHADAPEEAAAATEFALVTSSIDPLGLGTLVHAVLAEIDFNAAAKGSKIDVAARVARHAERHLLEPNGEDDEAAEMLNRFVASPLARQLGAAKDSHCELEFLLGWPPGRAESGGVYLRGFIDRMWQDATGDWHLLDFKTNRITAESLSRIAEKYEMQMLVYALAVERIFGRPPASLSLCFLRTGDLVQFTWNDAARRRVEQMVNDALAKSFRTT